MFYQLPINNCSATCKTNGPPLIVQALHMFLPEAYQAKSPPKPLVSPDVSGQPACPHRQPWHPTNDATKKRYGLRRNAQQLHNRTRSKNGEPDRTTSGRLHPILEPLAGQMVDYGVEFHKIPAGPHWPEPAPPGSGGSRAGRLPSLRVSDSSAAHFSRSELTRHGVRCGRTGMACGVNEPAWRAVRMNRHGPKVAACGMQRAPIVQTDP